MQAILLATAEGNQLRPVTENIPVPMLPMANRPLIAYAIELLALNGIKDIVVSLYHLPEWIEGYLGSGQRWGVRLKYVLQREPWGSAGALWWARTILQESFLVMDTNALYDLNLASAIHEHHSRDAAGTVLIQSADAEQDGRFQLGQDHRVTAINGTPVSEFGWRDIGIYLFNRHVLEFIPPRTHFEIGNNLLTAILQSNCPVYGVPVEGTCLPINSSLAYQHAQQHFLDSAYKQGDKPNSSPRLEKLSLQGRRMKPGVWVGRYSYIHPSAVLKPPVVIGDKSRIGEGVELGPYVVLANQVVVDAGATLRCSTILDYTYIGQSVNLENRLVDGGTVIDFTTGGSIQIKDNFLLGRMPQEVSNAGIARAVEIMLAAVIGMASLPLAVLIGFCTFLATGRVFNKVEHVHPAGESENEDTFRRTILRFYSPPHGNRAHRLLSWIKRLELDRLPEIWSVLKGELRLVGVKPLTETEVERLSEVWELKRNEAQPGFTGLWYIRSHPESELDEVLIADAYYVATQNWEKDLRLLLETPIAWWRRVKQ